MVGSFLGGNTRVDALHHLLEDAFVATPGGDRLSDAFLEQVRGLVSRAANPLYALMHESIYGQDGATNWAAWRVLEEFPEFRPDAGEPLLTGEMVYPWYFEQDPALRPLQDVARLLAEKDDWAPALRSGAAGAEHRACRRGRLHRRHLRGPGALPGDGRRRPGPAGVGIRRVPPRRHRGRRRGDLRAPAGDGPFRPPLTGPRPARAPAVAAGSAGTAKQVRRPTHGVRRRTAVRRGVCPALSPRRLILVASLRLLRGPLFQPGIQLDLDALELIRWRPPRQRWCRDHAERDVVGGVGGPFDVLAAVDKRQLVEVHGVQDRLHADRRQDRGRACLR